MRKILMILVVMVVVAIAAAVWYFVLRKPASEPKMESGVPVGAEGTVPSEKVGELTETSLDKVGGALNVNPAEKANPFSNIKTNPFE